MKRTRKQLETVRVFLVPVGLLQAQAAALRNWTSDEMRATEFEEAHNLAERTKPTGYIAVADVHGLIADARMIGGER